MKENTYETEWSPRQECEVKCVPRPWRSEEEEALTYLIRDGHKFKKCWNEILKFTLLTRSEGATSGKWYERKKFDEETDSYFNEKYWSYGPFNKAEKKTFTEKAKELLLGVRTENLTIPMKRNTCRSTEEYYADRLELGTGPIFKRPRTTERDEDVDTEREFRFFSTSDKK